MSDAEDGCSAVMFKAWSVESHGIHKKFQRDLQKKIKINKFVVSQLTCSHVLKDVLKCPGRSLILSHVPVLSCVSIQCPIC